MARISFHKDPPPIALLTDYGSRDNYVGVMKGVIQRICPEAHIIDLSHNIGPQDVTEAAFALGSAYRYFPADTVFACVVGIERAVVCVQANQQVFLAPDNGVLSLVVSQSADTRMFSVENERYFLDPLSSAFPGRDVFAPVAAHLCAGVAPEEMGPPVGQIQRLRLPRPVKTADGVLQGQVIHVDHFGNLVANITDGTLNTAFRCPRSQIELRVKSQRVRGISSDYCDAEEGGLVALIGRSGYLEVGVNRGSAARALGCAVGDTMILAPATEDS